MDRREQGEAQRVEQRRDRDDGDISPAPLDAGHEDEERKQDGAVAARQLASDRLLPLK